MLAVAIPYRDIERKKETETDKNILQPSAESDWPPDYAVRFWEVYPRRRGKGAAMKALLKVRKTGLLWETLITGVKKYRGWAATKEIQYVKHPATWLNKECWDDELTAGEFTNGQGRPRPLQDDSLSASKAAARLAELARRGEFKFSPRPSLLPGPSENVVPMLPKR
jgi:hypothetical protein